MTAMAVAASGVMPKPRAASVVRNRANSVRRVIAASPRPRPGRAAVRAVAVRKGRARVPVAMAAAIVAAVAVAAAAAGGPALRRAELRTTSVFV